MLRRNSIDPRTGKIPLQREPILPRRRKIGESPTSQVEEFIPAREERSVLVQIAEDAPEPIEMPLATIVEADQPQAEELSEPPIQKSRSRKRKVKKSTR